jgi:hypothetical protein
LVAAMTLQNFISALLGPHRFSSEDFLDVCYTLTGAELERLANITNPKPAGLTGSTFRSSALNLQAVPATITQLSALAPPADLPNDRRIAPAELTTYVVRARLLDFKRENDDDFHLVIAEPGDRSKTMIAEIPARRMFEGRGAARAAAPGVCGFIRARAALVVLVGTSDLGKLS